MSNIPITEKYKVEIKLSDNKKYFLGEINALQEEDTKNIECKEVVVFNSDFVVK